MSAIVDPAGRVVGRTDLLARANLRGTVTMLDGETVYAHSATGRGSSQSRSHCSGSPAGVRRRALSIVAKTLLR